LHTPVPRAWMQVGDARFKKEEINRLYDDFDRVPARRKK
jgi:hypothetical protein